jgi:hypothetical protein
LLYEEKIKWRLGEELEGAIPEGANYRSLADHEDEVESQFIAEESEGLVVRMSDAVFKATFGSNYAVAPLAVLQEADKLRVLFDGTNQVGTNHKIRVRDQMRFPGAPEAATLLREEGEAGLPRCAIVFDIAKAHRRIKIDPKEWGYQTARVKGQLWVSKVACFGLVPAAYWFGRLASALLRAMHYMLTEERPVDALLYADDGTLQAHGPGGRRNMLMALALLCSWGVPLKWKKVRGGIAYSWVGLFVDHQRGEYGLSPGRAAWLCKWLRHQAMCGWVGLGELQTTVGRLNFVTLVLLRERPILGLLYSWLASSGRAGSSRMRLPQGLKVLFLWLAGRLERSANQLTRPPPGPCTGTPAFATDAGARDGRAFIGGWLMLQGDPAKAEWFAMEVRQDPLGSEEHTPEGYDSVVLPWLFVGKCDPQRRIAALELLASIVALKLFAGSLKREESAARSWHCAASHIQGVTDNKGNESLTRSFMSTKYPLPILLGELMDEMALQEVDFTLEWWQRDLNTTADALTHFDMKGMDPAKRRWSGAITWLTTPWLLPAALLIYQDRRAQHKAPEQHLNKGGAGPGPISSAARSQRGTPEHMRW